MDSFAQDGQLYTNQHIQHSVFIHPSPAAPLTTQHGSDSIPILRFFLGCFFFQYMLRFLNDPGVAWSLLLSFRPCLKSSCTYCSPLWSKAVIISSQVLTVLSFPPLVCFISLARTPSNYLKYYARSSGAGSAWWGRQISVWGGGIIKETQRGEKSFVFCCGWSFESSLMRFILPPVPPSSTAIPLQRPGCAPHERQNVFPWKQTCHATAGLSNKIHLCREEPAGDPTNLTSVRWCDFWKPSCVWTAWAPAVIVPCMHLTESFALFISPVAFLQLYLPPSLLRLILSEHSTCLSSMTAQIPMLWGRNPFLARTTLVRKTHGSKIKKLNDGCGVWTNPPLWGVRGEPFFYNL